MKEKRTSLKFKKTPDGERFKVYHNVNEDGDALDIAIHDLGFTTDSADNLILVAFSYKLNATPEQVVVSQPAPFITQTSTLPYALYQFSVDFEKLGSGQNSIAIFTGLTTIGNLEFFKEDEDVVTQVRLDRPGIEKTADQVLWETIADHNLIFSEYHEFIDAILCDDKTFPPLTKDKVFDRENSKARSSFIKSEEYNLIKFATDFYMLARFEMDPTQLRAYARRGRLPYYDIILEKLENDATLAKIIPIGSAITGDCLIRADERIRNPIMIELIWNYWMEQGMLVQAMNVINLHFQNIKVTKGPSPLDRFHADPLRPMSHIIWGYIQDEQHRLSLPRRVSEYNHEYGLSLTGRAVMPFNAADARVKFLEAFHLLLNLSYQYFKESDDTTYIADAFPILTALREVHLLLAEGNHNAYGNLTWTARQEMMMQQYILARPEMREFLGGRIMVPYPETWMDRVDTMRGIMNWGGTSILHFYELAIHGEQVMLSIRYGNWSDVKLDRTDAANWAQRFRNGIYRYIHAYRTVTGVDLSAEKMQSSTAYAVQPAVLMKQRLIEEKPALFQQQRLLRDRRRRA